MTTTGKRNRERSGNRAAELWHRGQRGWPRAYPVVKVPNGPLATAMLAWVGAALTTGDPSDVLTAISRVALAVWAYQELTDGGNVVRRLLGLGFLVYVVAVLAGR